MSQAQIVSEKAQAVTFEIVPNPDAAKSKQRRQRSYRHKSDASVTVKKENSPQEQKKSEVQPLKAN